MKWLLSVPLHLLSMAVVFATGYLLVDLFGFREATTVLSGTFASDNELWESFKAVTYLVFYFGFVVASPILVIAAAVLAVLERLFLKKSPPA